MKRLAIGAGVLSLAVSSFAAGGSPEAIRPITLGETMPDFTLPALQGGEVSLSSLRGKNVVLVFPRVQYKEGAWCALCNYAHLELAQLEAQEEIRKTHNAEILVVVPFGRDKIQAWLDATPEMVAKVNGWKHPEKPEALDAGGRAFMERMRLLFPDDLSLAGGSVPLPFPILLDPDRKVSGGLGLFQTEWGGTQADQQIPTVMILDTKGVVRFKHLSQDTFDRPSARVIADTLEAIAAGRHPVSPEDRAALVAACHDYVEGWYGGKPERMARSLHPDLAKRSLRNQDGKDVLWRVTRDDLLKKTSPTEMGPNARIGVTLLDVGEKIATAKIVSPRFVDYVHFVRQDGRWLIVNVVWE
jgi:peroxiredoxin